MTDTDIATRFAVDTAEHTMTVLHDDGLYRHLRFQAPNSFYWFDLITAPGSLVFQGDGDSFVFRRVEDMFTFFRGPVGQINPHYWSEKLTSGRDEVMKYDQEIFEAQVKEAFVEAVRARTAPTGLGKAVREEILDSDEIGWEDGARRVLETFAFYNDDTDRYGGMRRVDGVVKYVPPARPDFEFSDTWEWNFRDYDWWFLWALHGIVWGIAQYDTARNGAAVQADSQPPAPTEGPAPVPAARPATLVTAQPWGVYL